MLENLIIAKNLKDALSLNKKGYSFYAGGTEINRLNSFVSFKDFVSLKKCGLNYIEKKNNVLHIGSMCTFQQLIENEYVPDFLKKTLHYCESIQKRCMATIGGNIANFRDDSFIISSLICAEALLKISGEKKLLTIDEYGELKDRTKSLIEEIIVPLNENRKVYSYRYAVTASSCATITLCMSVDEKNKNYIVSVSLKNYGTLRLPDVEKYLDDKVINEFEEEDFKSLQKFEEKSPLIQLKNDAIYGSAKYRKYLVGSALRVLAEEIKGA